MGIVPGGSARIYTKLFDQSLFAERFRSSSNALKNGAGRVFDSFPHTHSTMSALTFSASVVKAAVPTLGARRASSRRAAVKVQANMWPVRPRPFVARPSRFFVRDRYRERRPSSRSRAFAGEP